MYTHIILLILGETWSKGRNLTSLLLVDVFSELAEVNVEAEEMPRQNVFSYSYSRVVRRMFEKIAG